ncbi:hypothetical protein LXA43DRAFT_994441 [Ganoderma leucocontextum]|nr:hypothetical protein LXA43DRAFT_994441 [Ganoderma leucocontextum]
MDSMNLNIDVLHLILNRCGQNTVSQVMKTCRFLNREGVQYLLSDVPIIRNEAQASSFVQFALTTRQSADIAHRLDWMDSLHILAWDEEAKTVAEALKPFFLLVAPLAPNFSLLEVEVAEEFFAADPELTASVASLTTLDVLTLNGAGEKTVKMLRALQSRLTDVTVHFDLELGPSAPEDMDPVPCLIRSEDTLRCISLRFTISSPAAGCYRNVRMLTLDYIDGPTTRHFVQAFPNLRCLRATECTARDGLDPDAVVQRKRDLNVAEQALNGSWSSLTSYKGSVFMLYALGLACPVSHVYVHDDESEGMDPRQIRAVLGDTRPLHLTIRARGLEYILARAEDFMELCRRGEFQRLSSLRLNFRLWLGGWNLPDPEEVMNLIYDAIAPSPIPAITVLINISGVTAEPPSARQPGVNEPPSIPSRVKLFLDSLDADAVADRLFTSNPSRCAVKVVLIRNWKKRVTVRRGNPESIIELDFDKCF